MAGCKKDKVSNGSSKPVISADSLNGQLSSIWSDSEMPGMYVAVIRNGKLDFSRGYGFADSLRKRPFTDKTIMPVASVTKTLASIAIMKMIETGQLSFETDINDVLPFKVVNPFFPNEVIRVKHLVTHTSGIRDNKGNPPIDVEFGKYPAQSLGDFLKDYFVPGGKFYQDTNFIQVKPGGPVEYSNYATCLLAYLIEVRSGISYDRFVQKAVFDPLQLTSSHWQFDDARSGQYADLYLPSTVWQWLPVYSWTTYPDGSWRTSGEELCKFLIEMINGIEGRGKLLTPQSYKEIFTGRASVQNYKTGIFWFISPEGWYEHGGNDYGVATKIGIDPATRSAWVFMTNTSIDDELSPLLHLQYKDLQRKLISYATQ